MAGKTFKKNVAGLISSSKAAKSPDSDVSPRTTTTTTTTSKAPTDYFAANISPPQSPQTSPGATIPFPPLATASSGASTNTFTSSSNSAEDGVDDLRQASNASSNRPGVASRKSSTASVTFRPPRNPSLPQGAHRKTDIKTRLREASPEPVKFRSHVGFDNLPVGEATKNNPASLTLHAKHDGYQASRRSRTFMVGLDEHSYSDYALVWLLTNMVDDGDEVICVRVVETPFRVDKNYKEDAEKLLQSIQEKNEHNRAIKLVLEYAVGKLHDTFQQLLSMYNPSMLVVGTKGRSMGGIQGLVNTRNSFSKYCLQYIPIPVVVVRPDEKRAKKKEKRSHDPSRQSYAQMLAYNSGKHEADSETSSIYELEKAISADEEAHRVAAAIGLPARFDPTIKPYNPKGSNSRRSSPSALATPSSVGTASVSPSPAAPANESDNDDNEDDDNNDDSGDDDDDFEVEAVSSPPHLNGARKQTEIIKEQEQKKRLHDMEVGEAAALLKSTKVDEEDDDDESQDRTSG